MGFRKWDRIFVGLTALAAVVIVAMLGIVVGNITVGGTGKTPLVIWLADFLRQQGMRPGIVLRGYGGSAVDWPVPNSAVQLPW